MEVCRPPSRAITIELSAEAIRASVERIPSVFCHSPQFVSERLSDDCGRTVIVKIDAINPIGAFKGRGAWIAVAAMAEEGRAERGIVVASTGNFGQAVAYAGRAHRVPVTVFADERANPTKLERIRRFGATVIQSGHDFDAARAASEAFAREHDAELLVDGQDPRVAIGAGTLAVEVTVAIDRGDLPPLAAVYIPVGNGSLIVGVGTWLRAAAAGTRVIGVQSEAAPSMTFSWREGRPIETDTADTRAGGIATRVPVAEALDAMRDVVDDMVLVSEAAIAEARTALQSTLGVTAELSAGASLAGLRASPPDADGAVLVLVTGTNVEPGVLAV